MNEQYDREKIRNIKLHGEEIIKVSDNWEITSINNLILSDSQPEVTITIKKCVDNDSLSEEPDIVRCKDCKY